MKHLWSMYVISAILACIFGLWLFSDPNAEKGLVTLMTIGFVMCPYFILVGMENVKRHSD